MISQGSHAKSGDQKVGNAHAPQRRLSSPGDPGMTRLCLSERRNGMVRYVRKEVEDFKGLTGEWS